MLNKKHAAMAKQNVPRYFDFRGREAFLTDAEKAYFEQTVSKVLEAVGISIPVYMCDHEELPGTFSNALGIHWINTDATDEFITIDNFFIHESFQVAFEEAFSLVDESLVEVICHELAHIRYKRHTKYHAQLSAEYVAMVKKAA